MCSLRARQIQIEIRHAHHIPQGDNARLRGSDLATFVVVCHARWRRVCARGNAGLVRLAEHDCGPNNSPNVGLELDVGLDARSDLLRILCQWRSSSSADTAFAHNVDNTNATLNTVAVAETTLRGNDTFRTLLHRSQHKSRQRVARTRQRAETA